jgi:hypothetical protein
MIDRRTSRLTSMSYARPYRPRILALANSLLGAVEPFGLRARLTPESLLGAARRRYRLEDFGDASFAEPMQRLLESIEDEARLHPIGRFITRERLLGVLGNRLRTERIYALHPELEGRPVARPILITGLQRTGTTLLHRLLASDPGTRALPAWEAINPAPFFPLERRGLDPRVRLARRAERAVTFMAPDFFAIHPIEAESPEEDSILLDFSFLSPVAEATLRVPTYSAWLGRQDLRPAYRYMGRLLRLLEWQRPASRWVLKSPAHLSLLDLFLEAFPGARIVHTHRDPRTTLASYCSMIAHGRGVFTDVVDPFELGEELLAGQSHALLAAQRLRGERPEVDAAILDVYYDDLVRDPLGEASRIYEFAGLALDGRARSGMERCLAENPKHKYGTHRYTLSDFGLDEARSTAAFAPYLERHGARLEERARKTRAA